MLIFVPGTVTVVGIENFYMLFVYFPRQSTVLQW